MKRKLQRKQQPDLYKKLIRQSTYHVATKVTRRPKDINGYREWSPNDSLLLTIDYCLRQSGDHSKVEPPGPVPNPEVKHFCADGSWAIGPVRVGRRQFICPLQANACSGLFCAQMA